MVSVSFLQRLLILWVLLGAGVESMTNGYGAGAVASISDEVLTNQDAEDCLLPMGITSENVAASYNISRATQDAFAARSFQKAAAAQKAGKFKDEILPIRAKWVDPKTEEEKEVLVDSDDGIREGVTPESLGKLKPAFKKDGSTHAGEFRVLVHCFLLCKRSAGRFVLSVPVATSSIQLFHHLEFRKLVPHKDVEQKYPPLPACLSVLEGQDVVERLGSLAQTR